MKLEKPTSMQGRKVFETITVKNDGKIYFKPFTTSQLPNAKNHCATVALANVLKLYKLADSSKQSLIDVYSKVGNGPVIFLSRIIRKHYSSIECRYINKSKINNNKLESIYYLVCMPLSLFEWHWFVIVDTMNLDNKDYYVIFDGWNSTLRFLNKQNLKHAIVLEIKKTPTI